MFFPYEGRFWKYNGIHWFSDSLGAIIAVILDKTGAAITIAINFYQKTGENPKCAAALCITRIIAGLSVFCDSGFISLVGWQNHSATKNQTPPIAIICWRCWAVRVFCSLLNSNSPWLHLRLQVYSMSILETWMDRRN